jgi:hypothetical protein
MSSQLDLLIDLLPQTSTKRPSKHRYSIALTLEQSEDSNQVNTTAVNKVPAKSPMKVIRKAAETIQKTEQASGHLIEGFDNVKRDILIKKKDRSGINPSEQRFMRVLPSIKVKKRLFDPKTVNLEYKKLQNAIEQIEVGRGESVQTISRSSGSRAQLGFGNSSNHANFRSNYVMTNDDDENSGVLLTQQVRDEEERVFNNEAPKILFEDQNEKSLGILTSIKHNGEPSTIKILDRARFLTSNRSRRSLSHASKFLSAAAQSQEEDLPQEYFSYQDKKLKVQLVNDLIRKGRRVGVHCMQYKYEKVPARQSVRAGRIRVGDQGSGTQMKSSAAEKLRNNNKLYRSSPSFEVYTGGTSEEQKPGKRFSIMTSKIKKKVDKSKISLLTGPLTERTHHNHLLTAKLQSSDGNDSTFINKVMKTAKNIYYNKQAQYSMQTAYKQSHSVLPFSSEFRKEINESNKKVLQEAKQTSTKIEQNLSKKKGGDSSQRNVPEIRITAPKEGSGSNKKLDFDKKITHKSSLSNPIRQKSISDSHFLQVPDNANPFLTDSANFELKLTESPQEDNQQQPQSLTARGALEKRVTVSNTRRLLMESLGGAGEVKEGGFILNGAKKIDTDVEGKNTTTNKQRGNVNFNTKLDNRDAALRKTSSIKEKKLQHKYGKSEGYLHPIFEKDSPNTSPITESRTLQRGLSHSPSNRLYPSPLQTFNKLEDYDRKSLSQQFSNFIRDVSQVSQINKALNSNLFAYVQSYSSRNFPPPLDYISILKNYSTEYESNQIMDKAHKIYMMISAERRKRVLAMAANPPHMVTGTVVMSGGNNGRESKLRYRC